MLLEIADALTKHDPLIVSLKEWVDGLYEAGRQTIVSHKEMEDKINQLAPDRF